MSKTNKSLKTFKEYVCDGEKIVGFWYSYYYKSKKWRRVYFKLGKVHCDLRQDFAKDENLKEEILFIN